jgi:hypothetical protein
LLIINNAPKNSSLIMIILSFILFCCICQI